MIIRIIACSCLLASLCESIFDDSGETGLTIPENALGAEDLQDLLNRVAVVQPKGSIINDIPENRCYCTYGIHGCQQNMTCIKDDNAACFRYSEEVYNKKERRMEVWHKYGCAPLEKGSKASHLTCNAWRSSHYHPKTINCCYEGNYCNQHLKMRQYSGVREYGYDKGNFPIYTKDSLTVKIIVTSVAIFVVVLTFIALLFICKYKRDSKEKKAIEVEDCQEDDSLIESGSGSGCDRLNQRTVAMDLTIIGVIGQGRYGEVRKAEYRGSFVAVKTFYTTEEESWRNELAIYNTHLLNHENVLQFVAADICSEDSITQMLLITDYHELGSLCDYLRREEILTIEEAIRLSHSTVCGIEHLHSSIRGTGNRYKPQVAHRDIKSKNIIVKRPGVCCIADFGLAVRFDEDRVLPSKINIQVGTKRYMAPEVLCKSIDPTAGCFSQFKMADMYSVSLVLWEIARRVDWEPCETEDILSAGGDSRDSSGIGESISSDTTPRMHINTNIATCTRAKPYVPPFEGMVDSDPTFEDMRRVVCDEHKRPPIEQSWMSGQNDALYRLSCLMQDCWQTSPHSRHTALKVKKELSNIMIQQQDEQKNKVRRIQKLSTSSNGYGSSFRRDGYSENCVA